MGLPGMTVEIADAILDYIDADEEPRPYGAESEYYRSSLVPIEPRTDHWFPSMSYSWSEESRPTICLGSIKIAMEFSIVLKQLKSEAEWNWGHSLTPLLIQRLKPSFRSSVGHNT